MPSLLRVEYAAEVAPRHSKVRPGLYRLEVASLQWVFRRGKERGKGRGGEKAELVSVRR